METIKNTVHHVMGYDKDETSGEQGHHHGLGHHKHADDQTASTSTTGKGQSPADIPSKPTSAGNSGSNDQHAQAPGDANQGQSGSDPALVGDVNPTDKLTGTGEPGSHSALFGLTPDGKKSPQ